MQIAKSYEVNQYLQMSHTVQNNLELVASAKTGKNCEKIFDYVKNNKPCFYHCAIGADRTGTLSFMLEALLGVSSSDIDKDYEITSFHTGSGSQLRSRTTTDYVGLVNQMKSVTIPSGVEDTLRNRCVYFLAQGAYADDVNSFSEKLNSSRKTMIDGTPEKITVKT